MASERGESSNSTQYVDQELIRVSGLFEATEKQHKRREKISKVYHDKRARGALLLAVAAGTVAVGVRAFEVVKAHDTQHSRVLQAEAVVRVLQSAEAIRSLNLTAGMLQSAQQSAETDASSADGFTAEGYRDLSKLYLAAAGLAMKAHNTEFVVSSNGYPEYRMYVNDDKDVVTEAPSDVLEVSPAVAAIIAERFLPQPNMESSSPSR